VNLARFLWAVSVGLILAFLTIAFSVAFLAAPIAGVLVLAIAGAVFLFPNVTADGGDA
jgi:hypothetical protein